MNINTILNDFTMKNDSKGTKFEIIDFSLHPTYVHPDETPKFYDLYRCL